VTDVIEPGVFVIDAATYGLQGRVEIEATDLRAPGSSPSTELAASDALVAVTGHGQGDVAVIDSERLTVDHVVRAGRSLRGIAVDGTTVWVGDDADDTVRRVEPKSGVVAATSIEGRPSAVRVGLGQIWVTASTNVIPMRSPLHRLEPGTGNIAQTTRGEWSGDALCTDQHTVWLVDEFHEPAPGEQLTADEDEEWNSQSALIGLDPESLTRVKNLVIAGQVHDIVAAADRLWALTFSAADQAHVLVAVDTATGQQERISLGHIDVSSYNPPPQPAPQLQDEAFFEAVRTAVEHVISDAVDPEQCRVELAYVSGSPRLIVNVVEETVAGRSWQWDPELSAETDRDVAAVEHLTQVVEATFLALWASRLRVPTSSRSSRQRLD
jgi:hypothetical protein